MKLSRLTFRLSSTLRRRIGQAAKRDKVEVSEWLRAVTHRAIKDNGRSGR